ncbi:MAG: carbohydrate ABC transporter permease [Thermoleophilaceae bacterium]
MLRRAWHRWWFVYAMLAPVMLVMGVLVLYPIVDGVRISLTDADRFTIGNVHVPARYEYIGLENYADIFTSRDFRRVLGFTAIWTFVNVLLQFTIGLGLAVALNRTLRFRGAYRVLLLVPWAVPTFITAFTWRFLFNTPYGFFDQALRGIGLDGPAWLGDPSWAKVAVIATNVWLAVPFFMVALLGGLQSIDRNLLDAASVDGAGPLRRFWDITLPGLRPIAATVVLLGVIWTFNAFNIIFLMTGGGPAGSTDILVTFAYEFGFESRLYGVASAYGVIILSLLLVFGGFYRRVVTRLGEETWA